MLKFNINSGCTRKILDSFLPRPERRVTFKELRDELKEYSETEIRKSLLILKRTHIFEVDFKRGRPKGGERIEIFTISKELAVFDKLLEIYMPAGCREFLESEFINRLLDYYGFIKVFNLIKKEFHDNNFKKLASSVLFKQPALIKEYSNYPNVLAEMPEFLYDLAITPFPHDDDIIKMLSLLDQLSAIEFYRERIGNTYKELYKKKYRCFIID
jgi:hypothetical protein